MITIVTDWVYYCILFYFIKNNNLQLYFATNISVEKGISMVIRKESQN